MDGFVCHVRVGSVLIGGADKKSAGDLFSDWAACIAFAPRQVRPERSHNPRPKFPPTFAGSSQQHTGHGITVVEPSPFALLFTLGGRDACREFFRYPPPCSFAHLAPIPLMTQPSPPTPPVGSDIDQIASRLVNWFAGKSSCGVALSGGVDSAVAAAAAWRALGESAFAFTAVSASLAAEEREWAANTARQIGIRHIELATDELQRADYRANRADRCFHCKTTLYETARQQFGDAVVLANGANLDDVGDFRPGMQAATEHRVDSPLIECEIDKATVRELAQHWQLQVWDKPASPCLSSRIAYGVEVTAERLAMIEQAERCLRRHGFGPHRVRFHAGQLARLELQEPDIARLADGPLRAEIDAELKSLGFRFVCVELSSFVSGSLNQLVLSAKSSAV